MLFGFFCARVSVGAGLAPALIELRDDKFNPGGLHNISTSTRGHKLNRVERTFTYNPKYSIPHYKSYTPAYH